MTYPRVCPGKHEVLHSESDSCVWCERDALAAQLAETELVLERLQNRWANRPTQETLEKRVIAAEARLVEAEQRLDKVRQVIEQWYDNKGSNTEALEQISAHIAADSAWPTQPPPYLPKLDDLHNDGTYPPSVPYKVMCYRCQTVITDCKCGQPIVAMVPDSASAQEDVAL